MDTQSILRAIIEKKTQSLQSLKNDFDNLSSETTKIEEEISYFSKLSFDYTVRLLSSNDELNRLKEKLKEITNKQIIKINKLTYLENKYNILLEEYEEKKKRNEEVNQLLISLNKINGEITELEKSITFGKFIIKSQIKTLDGHKECFEKTNEKNEEIQNEIKNINNEIENNNEMEIDNKIYIEENKINNIIIKINNINDKIEKTIEKEGWIFNNNTEEKINNNLLYIVYKGENNNKEEKEDKNNKEDNNNKDENDNNNNKENDNKENGNKENDNNNENDDNNTNKEEKEDNNNKENMDNIDNKDNMDNIDNEENIYKLTDEENIYNKSDEEVLAILPKNLSLNELMNFNREDKKSNLIKHGKKSGDTSGTEIKEEMYNRDIENHFGYNRKDPDVISFYFLLIKNKDIWESYFEKYNSKKRNGEDLAESTKRNRYIHTYKIFGSLKKLLEQESKSEIYNEICEMYNYFRNIGDTINDKMTFEKKENIIGENKRAKDEKLITYDNLLKVGEKLRNDLINSNLEKNKKEHKDLYNAALYCSIYTLSPPTRGEILSFVWDKNFVTTKDLDYIDLENREFIFNSIIKTHQPDKYKFGVDEEKADILYKFLKYCREIYPSDKYLFSHYHGEQIKSGEVLYKNFNKVSGLSLTQTSFRTIFCSSDYVLNASENKVEEFAKKMRTSVDMIRSNYKKIDIGIKNKLPVIDVKNKPNKVTRKKIKRSRVFSDSDDESEVDSILNKSKSKSKCICDSDCDGLECDCECRNCFSGNIW